MTLRLNRTLKQVIDQNREAVASQKNTSRIEPMQGGRENRATNSFH